MTNEEITKFVLNGSRFDQSTFSGRFKHLLDIVDPRVLLTNQAELKKSVAILNDYKDGKIEENKSNTEMLWRAQKIKQSIIHPDTGEKILMPFRMSGYVPFGSPIVVGLLLPNQTMATTIFWQWLNQSHNACVNYSNRNASKKSETKDFVFGYIGAVSTAVSIALGLGVLVKKANTMSPASKVFIQRFIPFPAVASASVCNVLLMRRSELSKGIDVVDSRGDVIGVSQVAAYKALKETALTRAVLPAPILILPPVVMTLLEKTKWFPRYPRLNLPMQAFVCTISFGFALPLAIALFPQMSTIKVTELEKNIQQKTSDQLLFYNKGL